jgi:peptide/nickel transport system substrate-binding protein
MNDQLARTCLILLLLATSACLRSPARDPGVIVVGVVSGPNNLGPRVGTDAVSQNAHQLIFNGLMRIDEHLKIVPDLAERLDNPEPTVYVATLRKGVRFHDGHELTSADVVYTFRSIFDPTFATPYRGALRMLKSVDARDRYTVIFTLNQPFGSFPVELVLPQIVPDGAGHSFNMHPVGTGPYKFVRNVTDERVELAAFDGYFGGRPSNRGVVLKVIPDNIMAGLELRKGVTDVVVNDLPPDIVYQLERDPKLRIERSPGTDYQYTNLRDTLKRRCAAPSATPSTATPSLNICAAVWRFRPSACSRGSRGHSIPTCRCSTTTPARPVRSSTRPAIPIRTATVPRRGCI